MIKREIQRNIERNIVGVTQEVHREEIIDQIRI